MLRSMVLAGVALAGVAVAEESSWSSVMSLVKDATTYTAPERARRQEAPDELPTGNSSKVTAAPLQGYLDNPEYFTVDYCARYTCKCTQPYTTDPTGNLSWTMYKKNISDGALVKGRSWNAKLGFDRESNTAASDTCTAGCVCRLNDENKFEQVCMWDERMCDCQSADFFDEGTDGVNGAAFLYPQSGALNQSEEVTVANRTQGRAVANMKAMRANRQSNTANVCIACQSGMVLSGGQCYAGGTVPVAINMGIVVGLLTVPSIIGFWYVLHQIVDPSDTGMEIGDVKKSS